MYVTNNPEVALIAEESGVDRIWIDLEFEGKAERQKGDTLKSSHTVDDIKIIRRIIKKAELIVRINPWGERAKKELEKAIEYGADIIMLPMWKTTNEVKEFIHAVNHRCKTMLLLETKEAETVLDDVLNIPGIDEIHIGINDLSISYGASHMFEMILNGNVERIIKKVENKNIPVGFGGIAKLDGSPIPARLLIAEHYKLKSSIAILSRSFCKPELYNDLNKLKFDFWNELKKIRAFEEKIKDMGDGFFESNETTLFESIRKLIYGKQ